MSRTGSRARARRPPRRCSCPTRRDRRGRRRGRVRESLRVARAIAGRTPRRPAPAGGAIARSAAGAAGRRTSPAVSRRAPPGRQQSSSRTRPDPDARPAARRAPRPRANIRRSWRFQPWSSVGPVPGEAARRWVEQRRRAGGSRCRSARAGASAARGPPRARCPAIEVRRLVRRERPREPDRVLALDAVARMEDRSAHSPSFVSSSSPSESRSSRPTG